ncbi:hypothetical protein HK405_004152 [Cladochytrium tenue]|nr:hypothetical protein HK405_004152 [Cladochytrium tenue]
MPGLLVTASAAAVVALAAVGSSALPVTSTTSSSLAPRTDAFNGSCPVFSQPAAVAGVVPVSASVDTHLAIVSENPARLMAASTKSRYVIPAASVAGVVSESCQVRQVLLLARHGTRNPTSGDIKNHIALQTKLAANPPTNPLYSFLSNLTVPSTGGTNAGLLTWQGVLDHHNLAARIFGSYPADLFADPAATSWQATNVSRAIASGNSFIDGMYSNNTASNLAAKTALLNAVVPQTLDADLRPFDACAAYVNASTAATTSNTNSTLSAAAYFPPIATRLTALLGTNLTSDDVATLFSLCSFDNTLQGAGDLSTSVCSLFTDDELALYDFEQDLANDVNEGFGLPINSMLACSLVTTFVDFMDAMVSEVSGACSASSSVSAPTAVFRFAHEETIMPLVTLLGLYGGQALTYNASATVSDLQSRALHYSAASPFAANFIFELQSCASDWYVRVLHNEQPIVVPGCAAETCPLDAFKAALAGKIGCDFDVAVCGNTAGTVGGAATYKTLADAPIEAVKAAAGV